MEVRRTVAPTMHVHSPNGFDRPDRRFETPGEPTELSCQAIVKVIEVDVINGLEE